MGALGPRRAGGLRDVSVREKTAWSDVRRGWQTLKSSSCVPGYSTLRFRYHQNDCILQIPLKLEIGVAK